MVSELGGQGRPKVAASPQRVDIQIMRGIAVLAVLLFHGKESWFPNGYLGVDVFFVVSGLVVTPLVSRVFFQDNIRGILSGLRIFFRRRFFRLAPALGVMLAFSAMLVLLLGPVFDHERFAKQGLATLFLLGNIGAYHYSGGDYFAPNPNPLVHTWSLSAEEQIYLLLPLVLIIVSLFLKSKKPSTFIKLLVGIGICAFALDAALVAFPQFLHALKISNASQFEFYSPISRLWEFSIGSTIYFLSLRPTENRSSRAIVGQLLVAVSVVFIFLPAHGFKYQNLLVCLAAGWILHIRTLDTLPMVLSLPLEWMGDRSYSIYLLHMPLVYIAHFSPLFTDFPVWLTTTIAVALSILGGHLSYRYVEQRYRLRTPPISAKTYSPKAVVLIFLVVPILIFSTLTVAAHKGYWQGNPNGSQPIDAGLLDTKCSRMDSIEPCPYPVSNATASAILIGDSHAGALSQAFIDEMSSLHISSFVWSKGACQPIREQTMSGGARKLFGYGNIPTLGSQSCSTHNEEIWKWVALHPDTSVFVTVRSSSDRPIGVSETTYRNLLATNLKELSKIARKLIFIGPNPEFPDKAQYFSSPRLIWQLSSMYPKDYPEPKMVSNPFADSNFYKDAFVGSKVRFLDSIPIFCSSKTCLRWENSKWLYRDNNHLSIPGAQKLKHLMGGAAIS